MDESLQSSHRHALSSHLRPFSSPSAHIGAFDPAVA